MNSPAVWLALIIGFLLGTLIGAVAVILLRKQYDGGAGLLRDQLVKEQETTAALREEAEGFREQFHTAQQQLAALQGQLGEVQRRREEELAGSRERESLVEMLHPVRQGVTEMQRRMQELETERAQQHSALSTQLAAAASTDAKLIESTQALLGSLHAASARGHWGEVQLRRVVESAGMLAHVDFTEQHTARTESGQTLRPDMVVHLPGGRDLVVDAKAPLNPQDPAAQARALRQRAEELSKKRYWDAVELSPDVVFCFIPAESLLSAALEADGQLLDDAMAKGVSLVSPSSLLAALKAVASAWRQERLAQNISEVVEHSRELYRRLKKMSEHLGQTGTRLRQTVEAYNGLIGNIERQVLPKLESMNQLQITGDPGETTQTIQAGAAPGSDPILQVSAVRPDVQDLGPRMSQARDSISGENQ